jgi:hypothetical protein
MLLDQPSGVRQDIMTVNGGENRQAQMMNDEACEECTVTQDIRVRVGVNRALVKLVIS